MTMRSKQWYANASSSPNSLANSSICLLPPLCLSRQQEHWDRGPMEIKSAEDRTTTGWNTPTGFSRPLSGGRRGNFKYFCLDFDPFHFVERKFLSGAIVKLGRPGRFVVGDGLGVFERAPIFKICGDTGRTESVTTRGVGQAGGPGATLDHVQHVESGHRLVT